MGYTIAKKGNPEVIVSNYINMFNKDKFIIIESECNDSGSNDSDEESDN